MVFFHVGQPGGSDAVLPGVPVEFLPLTSLATVIGNGVAILLEKLVLLSSDLLMALSPTCCCRVVVVILVVILIVPMPSSQCRVVVALDAFVVLNLLGAIVVENIVELTCLIVLVVVFQYHCSISSIEAVVTVTDIFVDHFSSNFGLNSLLLAMLLSILSSLLFGLLLSTRLLLNYSMSIC